MAASDQFEKSPGLWLIVSLIVGLNLWYDYHHPGWLVLDGIILIMLLMALIAKRRRTAPNHRTEN